MSLNELFDRVRKKKQKEFSNDEQQRLSREASPSTPSSSTYKKIHNSGQGQTITFENVKIDFPLRPYAAQIQMMNKMIHAFNNGENALLESPTGSGKSLALLCAALAWREHQERIAAAEIKGQKEKAAELSLPQAELQLLLEQTHQLQESRKRKAESVTPAPSTTAGQEEQPPSTKKLKEDNTEEGGISLLWDDTDDDFQAPLVNRKAESKKAPNRLKLDPMNEAAVLYKDTNEQTLATPEEVATLKYDTYKKVPRIFIGSRTHKQIAQLVAELKYNTGYNPRSTILGSREHLCIHPGFNKKETKKKKGRAERVSEEEEKCPFAHNSIRIVNHASLKTINRVWEIDDLIKLGERTKGCPYYAARKLYEGAEVIFGPYNYIIDPVIRKILDINLKDSIVILDEAHNVEDAARSAGSLELSEEVLDNMIEEFGKVAKYGGERDAHLQLEMIFEQLRDSMMSENIAYTVNEYERKSCHWTGEDIIKKLAEVNITKHTFEQRIEPAYKLVSVYSDEVRQEMEGMEYQRKYSVADETEGKNDYLKCVSLPTLQLIQNLFMILRFIFDTEENHANDYQLVYVKAVSHEGKLNVNRGNRRKDKGRISVWRYEMAFWCLNPAIIFRNMCKNTRSVILTSGTLAPLTTFASELGVDFNGRLEANHVIKPSQVWISAIDRGPNNVSLKGVYSTLESLPYQDEVGATLLHIVDTIPFGVLCFVPSYKVMDLLLKRWKLTGVYDEISQKKMIVSEPKGSNKEEFEEMLKQFYGHIKRVENDEETGGQNGALLFAVFRGKVSEGIDFSDNFCRAVVTLGIPYPGLKDLKVKLKKDYNDKVKRQANAKKVLNGNQWYSAEAYRAMNQALGRCIRHKNDWGAIILLDSRFSDPEARQGLSRWVRELFRNHNGYRDAMRSLSQFAQDQMTQMQAQKLEAKKLEEEKIKNTVVIKDESFNSDTYIHKTAVDVIDDKDKDLESLKVEDASCIIVERSTDMNNSCEIAEQQLSIHDDDEPAEDTYTTVRRTDVHSKHRHLSYGTTAKLDSEKENFEESNHDYTPRSIRSSEIGSELEDFTNTENNKVATTMAMPSDTDAMIRCQSCSRELISCPRDCILENAFCELSSIQKELKDGFLVEIARGSLSITSYEALLGGPINWEDFPERREDVTYAREDEIAYCPLMCKCDKSTVIGVVVCLAGGRSSLYNREVLFAQRKVVVDWKVNNNKCEEKRRESEASRPKVENPHMQSMLDIPNTQYSAMSEISDVFYEL